MQITNPDSWFMDMLSSPGSHDLPESLRGVWWMKDNPGSETLVCFNKTTWVSDKLGFQDNRYNWCHDGSNMTGSGAAMLQACTAARFGSSKTRIEVGPSGKWINIGGASWIYAIQRDDKFWRPDGSQLHTDPGDMLRVSYLETDIDPSRLGCLGRVRKPTLTFQYLLKRVAYLDDGMRLVKTPAYDELAAQAGGPSRKTCCGELGCWRYSLDEVPPNDWQIVAINRDSPDVFSERGPRLEPPAQSSMTGIGATHAQAPQTRKRKFEDEHASE